MNYGLLLLGEHTPERLLNLAQYAEKHDFEHIWYADEKFFRDPFVSLTYLLQHTDRIKVGIAITDPYARHPALTAMAIGTMAELANGRTVLGLGAGFSGLQALGLKQKMPVAALREAVDLIRRLWAGESVEQEGKVISFYGGELNFEAPPDTPIIIATSGRRILRLAGELADGVMLGDLATATVIETAQQEIRAGTDRAGRAYAEVPQISRANLLLSDDVAAARERMRAWLINGMWSTYPRWNYYLNYAPEWEEHFAEYKEFLDEFGGKPRNVGDYGLVADYQHLITDEMVRDAALVGTSDEVAEQIQEIVRTGVDHLALYPIPLEGQSIETVLERFEEEVRPRIGA